MFLIEVSISYENIGNKYYKHDGKSNATDFMQWPSQLGIYVSEQSSQIAQCLSFHMLSETFNQFMKIVMNVI